MLMGVKMNENQLVLHQNLERGGFGPTGFMGRIRLIGVGLLGLR